MDTATVSVIVPTRDRPDLLEAALRSLLVQTRPVSQIVIVDDGSAAPDAARVERLRALSPVIELRRLPASRGPGAARNAGLDAARGDVLLFLDDDDLVHPRLIEDGLAVLAAQPQADAVTFLYELILTPDAQGESYRGNPVPRCFLEQRPVSAFLRFLIPIHSCLLRRSALGEVRFPEAMRQGEDTFFWISLARRGCRFVLDPRVYAFVRRHRNNLTRSRTRYADEIQDCYAELLAQGLLSERGDVFLAHLKLLWFKTRRRGGGRLRHLAPVLRAPDLLVRELAFWTANLWQRHRPLRDRLP